MSNSSFLILFIAFIAFMGVIPFLMRRLGIPSVIALLIVGMLIGPTGVGIDLIALISRSLSFLRDPAMDASVYAANTASHFSSLVDSLGSLGLMFLMALAGMEADFKLIKSVKSSVISLSVFTFLLPAAAGYWLYSYYCPNELAGKLLYASLFASHSVGIVFPVIRELKMSRTKFGAAVLISLAADFHLFADVLRLQPPHQEEAHEALVVAGYGLKVLADQLRPRLASLSVHCRCSPVQ